MVGPALSATRSLCFVLACFMFTGKLSKDESFAIAELRDARRAPRIGSRATHLRDAGVVRRRRKRYVQLLVGHFRAFAMWVYQFQALSRCVPAFVVQNDCEDWYVISLRDPVYRARYREKISAITYNLADEFA